MLGRLTLDALPHDPIVLGGVISMLGGGLAAVIGLTYFKKWKWLWKEWLTSLDPKKIGVMYLVVAILMLIRGGVDALMMRTQQATSVDGSQGFLSADHFQQVFSAHGTMMIFFVAMGLIFAVMNLLIPLMIGARDVAFPFLNSVSFWLFVSGMMLMNISLMIGEFSAAGWLAYPPLSGLEYSPGVGVDYWIWALQLSGIGSLLSGVNFFVTILKMRAPGMTLMKMPIFVWSCLGSLILIMFAFPILTATLGMLSLDRLIGTHFFTSDLGGNPMMYVNLIWAWGHPEVYILILPVFGIFSEVVATFSRKQLFGYTSMVWAIGAITLLSFTVWLHHFFTMGGGANVNAFFGIMTMIISVPTGVKVFNWLFTMYRGKVRFATPMLWFMGFIATFVIGGVTGVLMSVPAIDFQVHNSLFLVAHFHNMIIGGVVFGIFAGITYWWPKFTGFKLNEKLGASAFWCWLIGFILAFLPLYALGLMGATRRLNHYDSTTGWQPLFIVAAIGVLFIAFGLLLQVIQVAYSIWKRKEYAVDSNDPWSSGRTLEWATTSPPQEYNFASTPQITTRDAFWEMKETGKSVFGKAEDIYIPKNSATGVLIGITAIGLGFGIVWHIWWLVIVTGITILALLIQRLSTDDTERLLPAKEVAAIEKAHGGITA